LDEAVQVIRDCFIDATATENFPGEEQGNGEK
jgi:hypothetical protein